MSIGTRLIVARDPAATAANLLANEALFQFSTAALLISGAFYIGATLFIYEVLKPVNRSLSLLAAFFSLVGCAIGALACLFDVGRLIVPRDAVQTAANISGSEILFRLSLVGDLLIYASLVVLIWGTYIILKPINKDVALLASFFRLVEQAILSVTIFAGFIALRLLGNAEYLRAVDPAQLQSLARAFLSMYGIGLSVGFVFLGLGSAVFAYGWLKSGYIPGALAYLGIFASLLLTVMTLITTVRHDRRSQGSVAGSDGHFGSGRSC